MQNSLWNMFTSIRNGQMARKKIVRSLRKNVCESFLKILWNEGFILGYRISPQNQRSLEIFLKYSKTGKPAINSFKFISKPSRRLYYSFNSICKLDSSKLFIIVSTNNGLKSINECKKKNLGGEPYVLIN